MFYETVYETGRVSVAYYGDEAEAQSALAEQHRRAKAGEAGGPLGVPAERIAAVYVYDRHPDDYNPGQTMSADVAKSEVDALITAATNEDGVVSLDQLALAVRGLAHPMVEGKESSFDSSFKMKEKKKLALAFLESA